MESSVPEIADPSKKTLLEEILEWSQTLPEWQRDALRRLFQHGAADLTDADYSDLYMMMKSGKGVVSSDLKPLTLDASHLPRASGASEHTTLKAIRDLTAVNRLLSGQTLSFSSQGMTVVYGGNGTGKSGYARVLKKACRARDQSENVLTDASDPAQVGSIPAATFDIEVSGTAKSVAWALDKAAPDEMATIAVFDGKCARAYLTTEGEVDYIPYGLDAVAGLAKVVLPELENRLATEIATLDVDQAMLEPLSGNTKVGSLIEGFGPNTKQEDVECLADLTDEELKRLGELDKILADEDPRATANKVRLEVQRIDGLAARIDAASRVVSTEAAEELEELDRDAVNATRAMQEAAQSLRSGEDLLPGTGDELWRRMFEAAQRYSVGGAYPGHTFPHTDDGALCPLCQQELGEAGERLKRFQSFVEQDTAKTAQQAIKTLGAALEALKASAIDFQLDAALTAELSAINPGLPELVKDYQSKVDARRDAILTSSASHDWSTLPRLEDEPAPLLREQSALLATKADVLDKAANGEQRKALEVESDELRARSRLKDSLKAVSKLLVSVKLKAALEDCRKDLKTTGISTKAKALADGAVTGKLREALDDEFKKLGGVPFELKLADRSEKGKTVYKLQMKAVAGAKLEDILSEGEQRAIAIGSFLAELSLAGHRGGIIFDDPVSSLDHQRKGSIAKRLAEEAKFRQVIVFTHDIVFLSMLADEAKRAKAIFNAHWLEKEADGRAGRVTLNETPTTTKVYLDTKLARASIGAAEKVTGQDRERTLRQAGGELRRTLEEIVAMHLFKDVVGRWRENLRLTLVKEIHWDNSLADEIDSLFAELSRVVEGHSHTLEYSGGPPDIDELKKLADRVDGAIREAKKKRT